jgi:DNA-binding SARP family transcriptional activator/predicted ATPase
MEAAATSTTLRVRLLGDFRLRCGNEPAAVVSSPRLQSLLAYLVLHRDAPQLRQYLAFLFWPDSIEAQARNNLRQLVHELRHVLPAVGRLLSTDARAIGWRPDVTFHLDVAEFENGLAVAGGAEREGEQRAALERAVRLYRGDLLPTCYDEWIVPERERLRQRYRQALVRLIDCLETKRDYSAAIGYAQRLLHHDPIDEEAYRRLMVLLALTQDRTGALRIYQRCVATLRRELGVEPGEQTRQAYENLLRADSSAPRRAPKRETVVPLIGRQREWQVLQAAWRDASSGEPGFALITGEAGIGKTRLAEELLDWAALQGVSVVRTRCYAAEGPLSLAPVAGWLRSETVRPHLTRLEAVWLSDVSRILPELLEEERDLPPPGPITEYGQRQRFFEALARAVLAAPQPLLALIDDLQWCDQETIEWLHFLLRFAPRAHLLIVGTARAEDLLPDHPLRAMLLHVRRASRLTELALRPLDAAETARLAEHIVRRELDPDAAVRLYRETEGNPLFVVEMARTGFWSSPSSLLPGWDPGGHPRNLLMDPSISEQSHPGGVAGDVSDERIGSLDTGGRTTADESGGSQPPSLPLKVQAVIEARLAHLSPPARALAGLAAAIGRGFTLDLLLAASHADEDSAVSALDELWQKRIICEHGASSYDFTHDKLREVAYTEISAPQRQLLHRRIARALEALNADDLDPISGEIAAHYERAGLAEQAIPYYQRAATVAQRIYANEDAITLLSRGLAQLTRLPAGARRDQQELNLRLALAPLYRITRGWTSPEVERTLDRAMELCDNVGTDAQRAQLFYGLHSLYVVQARLEKAQVVSDELHRLYQRMHHAAPPLFTDLLLMSTQLHLGRLTDANHGFERMLAENDLAQVRRIVEEQGWNYAVHGRAWQAHALWLLGYPRAAIERGLDAVRLARNLAQPFTEALALTYLALLRQLCADEATAKADAEEALAFTSENKVPYYRAWSAILVRYARAQEQPNGSTIASLREALAEFTASGARLRLPYYLGLLASVCHRAGRVAEGLAAVEEGLATARLHNERWWDAELHRLRGELLLASGADAADAEAAYLRSVEIARVQQARSLELRAVTSLARLWQATDRADTARHLLGEISSWFTDGFETPDLQAARSLLATR